MIQWLKKLKGYWRKQPWCNKGKVKVTPWFVYAGTRGRRKYSSNQFASSAPTPCSGRFTPEKDMMPIVQDAAWAWSRHGRHGESRPNRTTSRYSSGGNTPKFACGRIKPQQTSAVPMTQMILGPRIHRIYTSTALHHQPVPSQPITSSLSGPHILLST
jgi:hypothetical protein